MPEKFMLALLQAAEGWARNAGSTLEARKFWTPVSFASMGRPEHRALLSAAAEVYDLVSATPEGCVLMAELNLSPEAGALPTLDGMERGYAAHTTCVEAALAQREGQL